MSTNSQWQLFREVSKTLFVVALFVVVAYLWLHVAAGKM
jgi:hypothetical protein